MSRKCAHDWFDHYMHTHFGPQLTFLTFIMGVLFDMESGSRGMPLPFGSLKFSHQTVSTV